MESLKEFFCSTTKLSFWCREITRKAFVSHQNPSRKPTPDIKRQSRHLDLDGVVKGLLLLELLSNSLGTHDTTTPVALGLLVLGHVTVLDSGNELGELGAVLGADLGEGEDGSGLNVLLVCG